MSTGPDTTTLTSAPGDGANLGRRKFLGFLIAAPTLAVAADLGVLGAPHAAAAPLPTLPDLAEVYDILDALREVTRPTANLIRIDVGEDGVVSFALPRSENGQGIVTSTAMIIAEEMDVDIAHVRVTLADARPELLMNHFTGTSNTTFTTYTPIRVAAALARKRLLAAAAQLLGQDLRFLTARLGFVTDTLGNSVSYGQLSTLASSSVNEAVEVVLKPREQFEVIGTPRGRTDARDIVTGRKTFVTDMQVPDALPTMICRAPDLNGKPGAIQNLDAVRAMPGITDVVAVSTGVAVRARTFGQAIDGVRALRLSWRSGTVAGENDASILAELKRSEIPLAVPPVLGTAIDGSFVFAFKSSSALETNCAIADVRSDRAEIWTGAKVPIVTQSDIAAKLGLPQNAVTIHVIQGGGSFGRKIFADAALEAAEASKAIGKPVKLMWHRADDSRQGRVHPMATSRVRAVVLGQTVVSFEQRHTTVSTDFTHGLGEAISAAAVRLPLANSTLAEGYFALSVVNPYAFGVQTALLSEVDTRFNTSSMRNVYGPDLTTARELLVDKIAAKMRRDPYQLRREFLKNDRLRRVLDRVAEEGNWGRSMPAGTAQGLAMHTEYKGVTAALVEIDCRPATVNRPIREGVTGPRVTKVTLAVDVGLVVNPRGLEAQMMGGINDAIALTLTSSLHLVNGHFVEASWDNYFYTRQWNTPPEMNIIVIDDSTSDEPGGAGELGVAAPAGAIACAYARATGTMPQYFPINHAAPFPFEPKPLVPPVPASPTNGLNYTY